MASGVTSTLLTKKERVHSSGSQPLPLEITDMARRNMSARKHGRKFGRARNKTRRINTPSHVMRGGIRL